MDELMNEESQTGAERRHPRKKRAPQSPIPMPAFLSRIGEDVKWYYDVRLWSPVILLLLIIALLIPVRKAAPEVPPQEPVVMETQPEPVTEPAPEPIIPEAAALARLADSVGSGRSDNVKTIIMWIAVNRAEDRANGYGQSLMDEISRPEQWQGYDEKITYSEQTYEIAKGVLDTIEKGALRPLDSDMLWLVLNDDGSVTVRNQFTASANQKWREKVVR